MEIITGAERRRCWRLKEKLRIVAEVEAPGASFAAVARRHEASRGLLWNWRQQVRSGGLAPELIPVFMPVQVTADMAAPPGRAPFALSGPGLGNPVKAAAETDRIEIALPDGTCTGVSKTWGRWLAEGGLMPKVV
jgi:transposase